MSEKIKIPIGLAAAICNSRVHQRAMAVYLKIKQLYDSGKIENYRSVLPALAMECCMSVRTLETRLADLALAKFIEYKNGTLHICKWEKIWTHFNIEFKNKRYWYYDASKFNHRLEYVLKALSVKEKKRHCKSTMLRKITKLPELAYELRLILGLSCKADINPSDIIAGQLREFRKGGFSEDESFFINLLNPDTNLSVRYLQKYWGYGKKSKSGPSYMKKVLLKLGLISVTKRESIPSEIRARKAVPGTVFYSRNEKKTKLQLCDDIGFSF